MPFISLYYWRNLWSAFISVGRGLNRLDLFRDTVEEQFMVSFIYFGRGIDRLDLFRGE